MVHGQIKSYLHICYGHWPGSRVCRSRKSQCHSPHSGPHHRLHTLSCYCGSHSALYLRAEKHLACSHADNPSHNVHCQDNYRTAQRTFLVAVDFIRTIVLAVVEVVAAQDGADATAAGALELILLTYWCGRRHFWKSHREVISPIIICRSHSNQ